MHSRSTHQIINTELPVRPDVTSTERPWAGITVQLHHWRSAGAATSPALDHDILAMRYAGRVKLEQRRLGQVHRDMVVPGNLGLHPRGVESRWNWDRPGSIVISRIPQSLLLEAAACTLVQTPAEQVLRNCFGARDPFVESILFTLAQEIQTPSHPAQKLIAESLSYALAAHLVHRFNVRPNSRAAPTKGLHPHVLSRVLDFIHGTHGSNIALQDLANVAGVSRFHFARMFRHSMNETPMAYVERERLLRAKDMLSSGKYSLATVAALTGFADQSHFGRRFMRYFGCTPGAYRSRGQ